MALGAHDDNELLMAELKVVGKALKWSGGNDPWVRSVSFSFESRTLTLKLHPPCTILDAGALLFPPLQILVYFPASNDDHPFCFYDDSVSMCDPSFAEAASAAAEAATAKLVPLARSSLLFMLSAILGAVASQRDCLWPVRRTIPASPCPPRLVVNGVPGWAERHTEAALLARLRADRLACEVSLALLSIALLSPKSEQLARCLPLVSVGSGGESRKQQQQPPPQRQQNKTRSKTNGERLPPDARTLEALLSAFASLPPLVTLRSASALASLEPPAKALLAGALLHAPVRFRTVRWPPRQSASSSSSSSSFSPCEGQEVRDGGGGEEEEEEGKAFFGKEFERRRRGAERDKDRDEEARTKQEKEEEGAQERRVDAWCPEPVKGCWAELEVFGRDGGQDWTFDSLRRRHGTRQGFHGSASENFHAICHSGLQNRSGTKLEKHGSVFGEGVYLAVDPAVSQSYCQHRGASSSRPRCFGTSALGRPTSSTSTNEAKSRFESNSSGSSSSPPRTGSTSNSSCSSCSSPRDDGSRPHTPWALFPFEIVARCEVIDLATHVVPSPGPRKMSSSSSSSSSSGDYLVVAEEGHIRLRSLLLFQADIDHAGITGKMEFRDQEKRQRPQRGEVAQGSAVMGNATWISLPFAYLKSSVLVAALAGACLAFFSFLTAVLHNRQ